MCVNFRSARPSQLGVKPLKSERADAYGGRDIWPGSLAPMLRRNEAGELVAEPAVFGLIPHWSRDTKIVRSTYNARSETVAEKPSFRTAWKNARFCLVPMECYFEPNWETGKAVRWKIARNDAPVFCIAAIWSWWKGKEFPDGIASFSLLTVNADGDPVLSRFHAPNDEKRSIVHVPPHEYDAWLGASPELARVMLTLPEDKRLAIEPAPRMPKQQITN